MVSVFLQQSTAREVGSSAANSGSTAGEEEEHAEEDVGADGHSWVLEPLALSFCRALSKEVSHLAGSYDGGQQVLDLNCC